VQVARNLSGLVNEHALVSHSLALVGLDETPLRGVQSLFDWELGLFVGEPGPFVSKPSLFAPELR